MLHLGTHKISKVKKVCARKKCNKKFSDIEIGRILQLRYDKKSFTDIAKIFKVHHFCISRIFKRLEATGVADNRRLNGRKRKTDRRIDSRIGREVLKDRFTTGAQIKNDLGLNNMSLSTIYRRINETTGCSSYWAAKKPFISPENRKRRLEWAIEHKNWTVEQWRRVFWTDESPFVLQYNVKRRVWRLHNERYAPQCITGTEIGRAHV